MKNMSPSLSLLHTYIIYLTQNHSIYISAKEHVHVHVKISAKLANSELISLACIILSLPELVRALRTIPQQRKIVRVKPVNFLPPDAITLNASCGHLQVMHRFVIQIRVFSFF
jgi:hypothetical protein